MPLWAAIMACLSYPLLGDPFYEKDQWVNKSDGEAFSFEETQQQKTKRTYYCSDFYCESSMDLLSNPRMIQEISKHKNEIIIPLTFNK